MTIDKNAEGAWRISALVSDGTMSWYETIVFYFYTRSEAKRQFRNEMKRSGYRIMEDN